MAEVNQNEKDSKPTRDELKRNKLLRRQLNQLNNILSTANLDVYGTDRTSDIELLDNKFQNILHNEINSLTNKNSEDITSFISKLWSSDNKTNALDEMINNQFSSSMNGDYSAMQSFLYDMYKNRLLEQADLHEVSSKLIELSEAILITRDAIISSDVVEGRMSRTLEFDGNTEDKKAIAVVEHMENKFDLLKKIKDFIIPKTLEYGEYYTYIIPYSKIFKDFINSQNRDYGSRLYRESTNSIKPNPKDKKDTVNYKDLYNEYIKETEVVDSFDSKEKISFTNFTDSLNAIYENITICNEAIPMPVLFEGYDSIAQYREDYVSESGEYVKEDTPVRDQSDLFTRVNSSEGVDFDKSDIKELEDIKDCYVKMIEPTKMVPIKLMDSVIGYYYVQEEDIAPLTGNVSNSLYFTRFNGENKRHTLVDNIVDRIVKGFNKKFLNDNIKFKKEIADAIQYYNLNEKKLRFQFIPAEYIVVHKIDEDEDGNGQSMIKKSLFYAKLYLMLLLFKIMSIIMNSNDVKVNYIKQSGIDKNISNKVMEIARLKQNRQINIMDLFSYTTLINKVGNGSEMYVPVGRSGDRPIETDILQGQDVQLNSDLLEMLKNAYILGTGVPAAIVNYLNEADFAKQIEQNNTKFNGRVVNYQLDFNSSITKMYKKIMSWSTNLSDHDIEGFTFTLQPPKTVASNAKAEAIQSFQALCDFLVTLYYDDPSQSMDPTLNLKIREFKKELARVQLPMLDFDKIDEILRTSELKAQEEKLKPNPANGDDEDLDVDSELAANGASGEEYPGEETGGELGLDNYPG